MLRKNTKKKYTAIFLVKEQESFTIVRRKKINPETTIVSYKNMTFVVDIGKYTFSEGTVQYYLFDLYECQLAIKKEQDKNKDKSRVKVKIESKELDEIPYSPEVIDDVVVKKIIGQLSSNLLNKIGKKVFDIITGAIVGGSLCFVIGFFVGGGAG